MGYADDHEQDPIIRHVCDSWMRQIEHAKRYKQKVFGIAAAEARHFYAGPKDWNELMDMSGRDGDTPDPMFKISVNKTFEFVTIFGPALYYENPVRTVKPRMPVDIPQEFFPDPYTYQALVQEEQLRVQTDGLKATLLGAYLNWSPHEFVLAGESRQAIDEALITGRSCLWTELYSPPGASFHAVRSYWDSVDNLLVDPDAQSLDKAKWIARRCVHPSWEVERDYGLPAGSIKGNSESQLRQADLDVGDDDMDRLEQRKKGLSNDLVVYWKIWSKMGIGGRLPGCTKEYGKALEMFGDYAYIVVAADTQYPLNLPPHLTNDPSFSADPDKVFGRTAWPTPFWAKDAWPVSCLDFHPVANCSWPLPHIKAGMGELKALNWIISFLVGHIRNSCRDFIAISKSAPEEIKTAILTGDDLTLLEIDKEHGTIAEMVEFLQHPQMNADIWTVVEHLENLFDKRVGLTELMYGDTSVQLRSAAEANIKNQNMNVRPADMAKQVETWQAAVATKEAMAARYHLISDDTRPVLGALGAWAWDQYVTTTDVQVAARELEYQIESGSTQKPNKEYEIQQMNQAFQTLSPVFTTYLQQTGDVSPMNALLSDFAKAIDLDPERYQLRMSMPPQPLPQEQGGNDATQQTPTDNPIPTG